MGELSIQILGFLLLFCSLLLFAWMGHHRLLGLAATTYLSGMAVVGLACVFNASVRRVGLSRYTSIELRENAEQLASLQRQVIEQKNQIQAATQDAAHVSGELSKYKGMVDGTRAVLDVEGIYDAAQKNDDRAAFDNLRKIAKDPKQPAQDFAIDVCKRLIVYYSRPDDLGASSDMEPLRARIGKLNIKDIQKAFDEAVSTKEKAAILRALSSRTDLTKRARLEFCIGVIKRDKSLEVVKHAGVVFTDICGARLAPLDVEAIEIWWGTFGGSVKD